PELKITWRTAAEHHRSTGRLTRADLTAERNTKVQHVARAAHETGIDIHWRTGRENRRSGEGLELVQNVSHLRIPIAVVRVVHVRARAEKRIRLVQEQDR